MGLAEWQYVGIEPDTDCYQMLLPGGARWLSPLTIQQIGIACQQEITLDNNHSLEAAIHEVENWQDRKETSPDNKSQNGNPLNIVDLFIFVEASQCFF